MRTHATRVPTTSEAGFTLLEALAAIAILCFGLLAVASMQSAAIQGNYTGRLQTEATTWAQDRMEKLLALPYDDATLNDTVGAYQSDPFPPSPDGYTIEYRVDADTPMIDTKLIQVRIQWPDKGFTRTNILTSVKPHL
jgi:Tfp pilus assembly protein PilV